MVKNFALILGILISMTSTFAFEDCIITSDGKLTDIKIKDNSIVKIIPIVTILNEKNTFIIEPLKKGKTNISMLKNNQELINFEIKVLENETVVEEVDGINILTLDEPETPFELDLPPILKEGEEANG